MNQLAQEAVLVALARQLEEKGSWTGETHLQKAAYLLSEIGGVDFDFRFILYKYGPFSFELRDELAVMREDGLLEQRIQDPRYGPRLVVTQRGTAHQARFSKTLDRYRKSLDFIAEALGSRGVMDLGASRPRCGSHGRRRRRRFVNAPRHWLTSSLTSTLTTLSNPSRRSIAFSPRAASARR